MSVRKDTAIRQKEIILAARKLIVKYGSEHVTVRKMAQEIGVTEAAIYRHFKSKRDVLSFLIDDIEDTLVNDINNNYPGNLNSMQILENIVMAHVSSIEQRRGVTFQVIAEVISLGDKKLNKKISEVIKKYIELIQGILDNGIKNGIIRSDIDSKAAARMFFSMTQGMVNIWSLSQYSFDLRSEYKSMWNLFANSVSMLREAAASSR
jgi:AcrR family transcriptional regulator